MPDQIDVHDTPWRELVLACRKCSKKLDHEGFGTSGADSLARAVRSVLRETGRRRMVRVVETRCLGLCPKRAVAVLSGRDPGTVLEVPVGTPASAVLDRLGVSGRPPA